MSDLKIDNIAYLDLSHLDPQKLEATIACDATIVCPTGQDAATIAATQVRQAGGVVLVVSKEEQPIGILDPGSFLPRVRHLGLDASELHEAVARLNGLDPTLRRSILKGLSVAHYRPPEPVWCVRGNHYATGNPCPVHR